MKLKYFICLILFLILFTGCGVNLYKPFVSDEPSSSNSSEENITIGKDALGSGDYTTAINYFENAANNPNSTSAEKADAKFNLALAQTGANNVTLFDMLPLDQLGSLMNSDDKKDSGSNSDTGSSGGSSILSKLLDPEKIGRLTETYNKTGVIANLDAATGISLDSTSWNTNDTQPKISMKFEGDSVSKNITIDDSGNLLINGVSMKNDTSIIPSTLANNPEYGLSTGMAHTMNTLSKIADKDNDGNLTDGEKATLTLISGGSDSNGMETSIQQAYGYNSNDTSTGDTMSRVAGNSIGELVIAKMNFEATIAAADPDGDGRANDPANASTLETAKQMDAAIGSALLGFKGMK